MKKLLLAAALLCAPTVGQGQVVIGTEPGAATTLHPFGYTGQGVTQTFIARGGQLARLSFWFYGGQGILAGGDAETFFTALFIQKGSTLIEDYSFRTFLSQQSQGRVDIVFDQPLWMTEEDVYSFILYTNNSGVGCAECAPIGNRFILPRVEMTSVDAFADGQATIVVGNTVFSGDVRFEAEFTVPEPSSMALLVLGAPLLLYRRRYSTRNPQSAH